MKTVYEELNKLGIACDRMTVLQQKDGITVLRIRTGQESRVLKCFDKEAFRREIENYRILKELNVPTLRVLGQTDRALLLEDVGASDVFRLGEEADLGDPVVARSIAKWYKLLHGKGYDFVARCGQAMYDESDYFTRESVSLIKEKTGTGNASAWALLEENFALIAKMLSKTPRTLTYNDFYYTNLIVAKDRSSAMMFDYNLLGKGYAVSDVRNVLYDMSPEAKAAFWQEYGAVDPKEEALDNVVSWVTSLYMACTREEMPGWAEEYVQGIDDVLPARIKALLALNM